MRNPALAPFMADKHHDVQIVGKTKTERDGGRQYLEDDIPVTVVDGMVLQPFDANSSKLTPVGPNIVVHYLGLSGPTTPIPMGKVLVDETERQYKIVGAQNWTKFWACALQDMGVPKS